MLPFGRYVFLFLLTFFTFNFSQAQEVEVIGLRDAFERIEQNHSCTFSFRDLAISNHQISWETQETLQQAIDYLERNSLFNFTLLQDLTVAVSPKQSLIDLCGTLITDDGTPLADVVVLSPYQLFTTDENGTFEAQVLIPDQELSFRYTGYEERRLKAEELIQRPCRNITLLQQIEQLQQVLLTNYISKGITKNLNGSLSINYEDFDILPGLIEPDVLQTIQALPGIQSVNETVSFINIRGGTNDQNLILLDGVKMYQSGHFFGLISAFNPFLTERVSVIKNGSAAAFGD